MEQYWPAGIMVFMLTGLVAVKVQMGKRPTYAETDKTYMKKEVCDQIHKAVDEKLSCIPDIKTEVTQISTKIDMLLTTEQLQILAKRKHT